METKTKVLVLWIDKGIPLVESIYFFDSLIKNDIGKSFKKVRLSITDKSKKNWKMYSRSFGNNHKGLGKLKVFLDETKANELEIDFALETLLKDYHYKAIDIDMHISCHLGNFCSIIFLFNEQENRNINFNVLIAKTFDFLCTNEVNIKYGFGFVMENKKMPGFFCNGIYTEKLTKKERETVSLISNKQIMDLINVPFSTQIINKNYVDLNSEKVKELINNKSSVSLDANTVLIG